MKHYHYIFTGTGLSAMMTVYEMVISNKFSDKNILLIDSEEKNTNDRTWCFWDKNDSIYSSIISKKWNSVLFKNKTMSNHLILNPYQYKMIKGLDFYNFILDKLKKENNITFLHDNVIDIKENTNNCFVKTQDNDFSCNIVINSILSLDEIKKQSKYPLIQQHFVGWFIKTNQEIFNPDCATFMDFSVEQKGNTRFMYVLPFSKYEALIEYTLFSKDLLNKKDYEEEIAKYIDNLGITDYKIIEKEYGNIPMTCYPFWKNNTKKIIHIGSAGGWTKASTGFTFKNSSKKSKELVQFLIKGKDFKNLNRKNKFWFYDLLLIDILFRENEQGNKIFSSLFKKGNPDLVLKFLDEETTLWEDILVIWKCPKMLFIKALFQRIFH